MTTKSPALTSPGDELEHCAAPVISIADRCWRHRTGLTVAGTSLLLGALLAIGVAPAASADEPSHTYVVKSDANAREGMSTSTAQLGKVFKGEKVQLMCQDIGETVNGNDRWDLIQYHVDGTDGLTKILWIHDSLLDTDRTDAVPGVRQGNCPAIRSSPGSPVPVPPMTDPEVQPTPPPSSEAPATEPRFELTIELTQEQLDNERQYQGPYSFYQFEKWWWGIQTPVLEKFNAFAIGCAGGGSGAQVKQIVITAGKEATKKIISGPSALYSCVLGGLANAGLKVVGVN